MPSLKKESLDQSIELMVNEVSQYFMPVRHQGFYSEDDLENVLSDRRTLKLLQEISALLKGRGSAACQLLFSTAFQRHTNACRAMIKYATDPSAPENHYSTLCSIMAMSAAMFIAADTARLDVLEQQFAQLDQWRDEIEPLAKLPNQRISVNVPALFDFVIAPDFRLQVNVLRLAGLRSGNSEMLKRVDEECARIQMKSKTIPIVPWNAETTIFEVWGDSPLDKSKGVTEYIFYNWSDKMAPVLSGGDRVNIDQKQFVRELESIVFPKSVVR
jgi:hypothetical protein